MLVGLLPVANLDEAKPLVVEIKAAAGHDGAAAKQAFRLLCHRNDQVALVQNVVGRNRTVIPFLLVAFVLEAAFIPKIPRSQNYVSASIAEVLTQKSKAMLYLEQVTELAIAPHLRSHPQNLECLRGKSQLHKSDRTGIDHFVDANEMVGELTSIPCEFPLAGSRQGFLDG